jgi:hypothetical protein
MVGVAARSHATSGVQAKEFVTPAAQARRARNIAGPTRAAIAQP